MISPYVLKARYDYSRLKSDWQLDIIYSRLHFAKRDGGDVYEYRYKLINRH